MKFIVCHVPACPRVCVNYLNECVGGLLLLHISYGSVSNSEIPRQNMYHFAVEHSSSSCVSAVCCRLWVCVLHDYTFRLKMNSRRDVDKTKKDCVDKHACAHTEEFGCDAVTKTKNYKLMIPKWDGPRDSSLLESNLHTTALIVVCWSVCDCRRPNYGANEWTSMKRETANILIIAMESITNALEECEDRFVLDFHARKMRTQIQIFASFASRSDEPSSASPVRVHSLLTECG